MPQYKVLSQDLNYGNEIEDADPTFPFKKPMALFQWTEGILENSLLNV